LKPRDFPQNNPQDAHSLNNSFFEKSLLIQHLLTTSFWKTIFKKYRSPIVEIGLKNREYF